MTKKIKYILEYVLFKSLLFVFGILDKKTASNAGGWLGKFIGQFIYMTKIANKNLHMVFPEKSEQEIKKIINGMWENFGRVAGEYPHMHDIGESNVEFINLDLVKRSLEKGKGLVVIGAHMGNWEVMGAALAAVDVKMNVVVREPNNPYTAALMKQLREVDGKVKTIPKSTHGTREFVQIIKNGGTVGILIDQKYNEGEEAQFFGHKAMTSSAFVKVARKFGCDIIPARMQRVAGCNFKLSFYPPMELEDGHGNEISDAEGIAKANSMLEEWIKDTPEQWIWMHRRWRLESRK